MLNEENLRAVDELKHRYPTPQSLVLPVLWMIQKQEGFISESSMKYVADYLQLPFGHVLGVVTFYTMFHTKQIGKYNLEVCTNISCLLRGSSRILEHLEKRLGIRAGETSHDKKWTLTEVECMGACGTGPMLAIGDEFYENLTIEKIDRLLDSLK